jgi:uncharacterized protein YcsI (UPF0317 family)
MIHEGSWKALANADPRDIRELIRQGEWRQPTAGLCQGRVQANLVILPRDLAYDFLLFAQRNPKPCPLLEVAEPGSTEPVQTAPGADLRRDLPKYRIYRQGQLEAEVSDLMAIWQKDLVSFLLGCSFTFEAAMLRAGVPVRHLEEERNVPMYITSRLCQPAGIFQGPLVVSMRPIPDSLISIAVQVTARFQAAHGGPVHVGDPLLLGIKDLGRPDFGDPVTIRPGEVPVFWACGVTPQAVAMQAKPPLMITHAPGHMFITDLEDEALAAY